MPDSARLPIRVHGSFCALRNVLENVKRKTRAIYGNLRRGAVLRNGFSLRKGSIHG